MILQGEVTNVVPEVQGGIVLSWAGSRMVVQDASDFSRDGGQFRTEDGSIYAYSGVVEGADEADPDVVVTVDPMPDGWPSGEVRVDIHPEAVDVVAEVETEAVGTFSVIVPHSLRPLLPDGVREDSNRERVLVAQRGGQWVVADVVGRRAMVQADAVEGLDDALADLRDRLATSADDLAAAKLELEQRAQANADAIAAARTELAAADQVMAGQINDAKTIANGKTKTTYATGLPGATPGAVGDQWFVRNATTGAITELWECRGGTSWQRVQMDGATLVAKSITALQLAAGSVTADKVLANEAYARVIGALIANFEQVFADKVTAQMVKADTAYAQKLVAMMANFETLFAKSITGGMLNVDMAMAQQLQAVMATFQSVFAGTITADMINLDTLNGKVLNGVDIYSPSATSTPRVHVGGATIETVRGYAQEDGAVTEVVGISLGGPTADKMQLLNPDGSVLAGFDTDGSGRSGDFAAQGDISATGKVTADAADFGSLSVGPYPDLATELSRRPRGVIARQKLGSSAAGNGVRFGATYLGYYELFFAPGDQLAKVTYTGQIYADGPGYYAAKLIATSSPDPDVIPSSPSIPRNNYTTLAFSGFQANAKGLYPIYLEGWVNPYAGSYRVLLVASVPSGGPSGRVWSTDSEPSWMVAESVGGYTGFADGGYNRGGGTPYSGSPTVTETAPVIVKKTYTSTWNATGVATYRAGIGSMSTSQYLLQQGTYGGAKRWSHVVFNGGAVSGETGKTIATTLSGATVSKVEFYGLVKNTYYGAGGTAVLAPAAQTALTSIATSSAESRFSGWKAGTAKWVTLSNALGTSVRSVAIGPDSSGLTEYIKFDPTLANLKLRITYTR